jgi:hypothetical protein
MDFTKPSEPGVMTQLLLTLDFSCWQCEEAINVKVRCTGIGLRAGAGTVAAAQLECPHCTAANEVCFHPTGSIVCVRPARLARRQPEPSIN